MTSELVGKRLLPPLRRFLLLLLLVMPAAARQGFAGCDGLGGSGDGCGGGGGGSGSLLVYTTNGVSATVTGVDGLILSGVVIPSRYYGLPVTSIGPSAFAGNYLTSVSIPDTVTDIGDGAFFNCASLTNVTMGNGVTRIGDSAFSYCTSLSSVYFQGNAPSGGNSGVFDSAPATVYYLPGTAGWDATFDGRPTALWSLPNPIILSTGSGFGGQSAFGFTISWATNTSVVVEVCTDLNTRDWPPVATNTLINGSSYFSDSEWMKRPRSFYRLRSP